MELEQVLQGTLLIIYNKYPLARFTVELLLLLLCICCA